MKKELTKFQRTLYELIPEKTVISSWDLAKEYYKEKWHNNWSSHGGMITAIENACMKLRKQNMIIRLPPKDQWSSAKYTRKVRFNE